MKSYLAAMVALVGLTLPAGPVAVAEMPFIEVDPGRTTAFRERGSAEPVVMVGVNYFDHQTGWAPRLWQKFDERRVRQHLAMLHDRGFNAIRVFLTYESFHREPGQVYPEGLPKFRRLLDMCRQLGIYVMPTGPDHWEGTPDWRKGDRFADEELLKADEAWWKEFAGRFKDDPVLWAYDLYNEPMIGWDSPAMKAQWNDWLRREYGAVDRIATAWNRPAELVGTLGEIPVPPPRAARNDGRLYDFQRFREFVGDEWARRMAAAIRSVDQNHLITVGHIQWVAPIMIGDVRHYAGFNPRSNAQYVDFTTVHFYPLDQPRPCDSPEGLAVNRVYLEAVLYQCSVGKPLVIGEFNWYGGNSEAHQGWNLPPKPAEHQVEWCQTLLDVSRGRACGWLNWAFADTPGSRDITRWSGLWTEDLKLKPWGKVFGQFARDTSRHPQQPREFPKWLTGSEFDHRSLVTDPEAGHALRRALRAAATRPD
ncbi:MAG TPA: cellulase family glycosylhydrolase [Phycisphaerae bacterium]|nr:cellulase family glycosylhydrolase [Phycisphaerae bacterium]HRR87433.1 cellulase family glycosylhydrolase [Phycisphaerae bacterium]